MKNYVDYLFHSGAGLNPGRCRVWPSIASQAAKRAGIPYLPVLKSHDLEHVMNTTAHDFKARENSVLPGQGPASDGAHSKWQYR